MQCNYFLILEDQEITLPDPAFWEINDYHRFNTLWWFEWCLEKIAHQLSVTTLTEFISFSRAESVHAIGEEEVQRLEREGPFGDQGMSMEAQWFSAEEGLHTVRTLLEHIHTHPESLDEAQPGERHDILVKQLVSALQGLAETLEQARQEQRRFRLYKI